MNYAELDIQGLEDILSRPSAATVHALDPIQGPIVILGAGGKMGPTLAMMVRKAAPHCTVYAISRFTDQDARARMEASGIETIAADLLQPETYMNLPQAEVVFYLLGMKFGASGDLPRTWALNAWAPCLAVDYYQHSKFVALSTGNVYPYMPLESGGATEETPLEPVGEYAQSCVARERMLEFFSSWNHTQTSIIRLNYANEPRYGIIVDLVHKIMSGQPIDLSPGAVNLIWQRDALDYIIQSVELTHSPPAILNVTGDETIHITSLAGKIASALQMEAHFENEPPQTALLSNAARCIRKFGPPETSLDQAIEWIVQWVRAGKPVLNKPTRFEIRDGRF
jgi:nucleoside-diphosphate-sugar epimerase